MFALTVTVFPQTGGVSWWLALSPCMLSCLPAAQIHDCSGHSLAAPSCRRLLSRSLTSAETSHHYYTETHGLPILMCLQIWHFGGKKLESLLVADFPDAVCWELATPPWGWQGLLLSGRAGLLEVGPGCLQTAWLKTPAGLEL